MCPTDALLAAVLQESDTMEWMPVLITTPTRPVNGAAARLS